MDFMKVIDQTVREIKREVNLKVLKVPEIEQKVLDATDDEPWGPHGTALSEIAQATKKFSECQMVMNVLWTRLTETDRNWRHVYKALAVIEYLVANGSERAVDDIIEHTFQISALSCFEYVEPSGKDSGINVRKKVETIVSLLNDKDKIQAARNKAAATRDKYVGLSSTGVTFKSGSAAALSSSGFQKSDRYGGFGGETFKDSEDRFEPGKYRPRRDVTASSKKPSPRYGSTIQDSSSSGASKPSIKSVVDNFSSIRSSAPSNGNDDDFDDFDPRGTSNTKEAVGVKMDLFGDSLIGDVWDGNNAKAEEEVDLFGDAAFVSAPPPPPPQSKVDDDVFGVASSPAVLDLFSEPHGIKHSKSTSNIVDPFGMTDDLFGSFSSSMDKSKTETPAAPPPFNKDAPFQVKSGVWADSLSRGLIDLNISGPKKKVDLTDVGIVGGLSSDKGGRPMNKSTATASSSTDLDDFFSFGGSFHN